RSPVAAPAPESLTTHRRRWAAGRPPPGGAAALPGAGTRLVVGLGPDGKEVNGLGDARRTLRVLGAAGTFQR
ncbi:hypothetical protein ACFWIO_20050, partial [Streptomyces diastatochromogenes]|uniref:hypothetical protein n=1 Tax=Streptomyces diastatochromogenes TaxID=42236 RepID=UPI003663EA59